MIVRNRENGDLRNIKDVNIKFHGTFSDIINRNTAEFLCHNTDPKVFFLDVVDEEGNYITKQYHMTKPDVVNGLLADIRFRYNKLGWAITRLRTYYKPRKLIQDEQHFLTNGLIQDPVMYTIIFNNDSKKTNE